MERVELVLGQQIEKILDFVFGEEVAAGVDHHSAPAKPRLVFNLHGRRGPRYGLLHLARTEDLRRQELQQGLRAVKQSGPLGRSDRHAVGCDLQLITFGAEVGVGALRRQHNGVVDRAVTFGRFRLDAQAGAAIDTLGQQSSDVVRNHRILLDENYGIPIERERAFFAFHPCRLRHQGEGGGRRLGRDANAAKHAENHSTNADRQRQALLGHGRLLSLGGIGWGAFWLGCHPGRALAIMAAGRPGRNLSAHFSRLRLGE